MIGAVQQSVVPMVCLSVLICEITSEGEVKLVPCMMNRLRHPGPTVRKTMSGLFYYFGASCRRSASAAEARRLGIDYVFRTVD